VVISVDLEIGVGGRNIDGELGGGLRPSKAERGTDGSENELECNSVACPCKNGFSLGGSLVLVLTFSSPQEWIRKPG
jgi:hypothetical protein